MPRAIVIGGGLAGMAAAAALDAADFQVELLEARNGLGGRAGSFLPAGSNEWVDTGQHILLGCCRNLLDFYHRLGVEDRIRFYDEYLFLEPGGRRSALRAAHRSLPARLASLLGLRFLGVRDKLGILRALATVRRDYARRKDLDSIAMAAWLRQQRQTPRALRRFWRPVLVSALNDELDRISALHGLQVLWLALLAAREGSRLGVPAVPLAELYAEACWRRFPNVILRLGARVERVMIEERQVSGVEAAGKTRAADVYVLAAPPDRVRSLVPELGLDHLETSPIITIQLWFDRPAVDVPQAALLDRTIQWVFNKREGRSVRIVVSAARDLLPMSREEVVRLAVRELADFFPAAAAVRLEQAHVLKHTRATFSPRPGLAERRPPAVTRFRNLFLAGDWTRTGWPATMEGAVRSGYLAAEAVTGAFGSPRKFLIPDPEP